MRLALEAHSGSMASVASLGPVASVSKGAPTPLLVMFAMRSFNYWGHGRRAKIAGFEFPGTRNLALNQRLFGYLASEWHNNHHRFPRSACYSFFPGQPDLAFAIIRGLARCGIVSHYRDDRESARVSS